MNDKSLEEIKLDTYKILQNQRLLHQLSDEKRAYIEDKGNKVSDKSIEIDNKIRDTKAKIVPNISGESGYIEMCLNQGRQSMFGKYKDK